MLEGKKKMETGTHELFDDELRDFLNTVNWEDLRIFVKQWYGIETSPIINISGAKNISITWPDDVKDHCGILSEVLESAKVESFGCGVNCDVTYNAQKKEAFLRAGNYEFSYEDLDAVFGEPKLWVQFDLRYRLPSGGSNGIGLFYATYTEKEGWSFEI